MSRNIKDKIVLLSFLTFILAGCKHYAAFPDLEEEGTLAADNQNITYDDSNKEKNKKVQSVNKQPAQQEKSSSIQNNIIEDNTLKEKKKEIVHKEQAKDLTIPNPEVSDIMDKEVSYVVPSKTTPVVINDIDLKEMDAEDSKVKVIKPIIKTKTILATKKTQKILPPKATSKEPTVFYLAETIYFSNGGSTVDNQYLKKLKEIVKEAKKRNGKIIVQGFASSRTKNTDIITHKKANLKVSIARAENVATLLAKYGMPKSRIITEGLSDSRPAYQEVMPEGERLNRRAEVYISY